MVCSLFSFVSLMAAVAEMFPNTGESEVLLEQLSCFILPLPSRKTIQHVSHIEKSKQHKHYQQTWGGTMIQRKLAPVRTKSTSSLLISNCWWHQSSLPDCLVRDQASSAQMQSRYRENRPTVLHTQPLVGFEKAKDEDERDGQSRQGRQSEG